MSFLAARKLLASLEGGKSDNPDDPGGATNQGIIQATWEAFGFTGSVLLASQTDLDHAKYLYWRQLAVFDAATDSHRSLFELMPEPADAVGFQFYFNVPPHIYVKAFQGVVGAKMDGIIGPKTLRALQSWNGRGWQLGEDLLTTQEFYYVGLDGPFLSGWLNRVEKVREWLKNA